MYLGNRNKIEEKKEQKKKKDYFNEINIDYYYLKKKIKIDL